MFLSKFMYFIHLHHICRINRETGVSQGSRSQSRQDTPSVTAAMSSSSFFFLHIRCKRMCPVSLAFLPCRRTGRVLYLTRFFFLLLLSSSFFFFFFLLSSGNTSFSHTSLHLILTKLAHSDRYLNHYSHTKDGGVRGHYGVTGVKKVIFTKNASSPSDYVASTRDFCICSSLTPSTKVMVLKNCQGSFGVTGVKSSFSQKRHQVLQIM